MVQNSVTCCAAAAVTAALALLASRFTAALAGARALPITLFAPLSHMLMNGFFFSQGLLKSFHLLGCCGDFGALPGQPWGRRRALHRAQLGGCILVPTVGRSLREVCAVSHLA